MTIQSNPDYRLFTFMGPTGSGKSTLYRAFWRWMLMGSADSRLHAPFKYNVFIHDDANHPSQRENSRSLVTADFPLMNPDPTRQHSYERLRLQRELEGGKYRTRLINAHEHIIHCSDFPGEYFEQVRDPKTPWKALSGQSNEVGAAWRELERSAGIFVILDPSLVRRDEPDADALLAGGTSDDDFSDRATAARNPQGIQQLSRTDYSNIVSTLAKMPTGCNPQVAICITKMDLYSQTINHPDPDYFVHGSFGTQMKEAIATLKSRFSLRVFTLSSLGPDGENYKDGDEWAPIRVEYPFFWMLDHFERQAVGTAARKMFFFPCIPWFGKKFVERIEKHYIPYNFKM